MTKEELQALSPDIDPREWVALDSGAWIHNSARLCSGVTVGDRSTIGPGSFLGTDVKIGTGVRVGTEAIICHGCAIGNAAHIGAWAQLRDGCYIYSGAMIGYAAQLEPDVVVHERASVGSWSCLREHSVLRSQSHLGARVLIGARALIAHGVMIGDCSRVAAGLTVEHNIGEYESLGTIDWEPGEAPTVILGTHGIVSFPGKGSMRVGCMERPVAWWSEHYKAVGRLEEYTDREVREYAEYISIAEQHAV